MKKIIIAGLILQMSLVFAQDEKAGIVGEIKVEPASNEVKIVIPVKKGTAKSNVWHTKEKVVADVFPAVITGKPQKLDIKDSIISEVQVAQFQIKPQKIVRIVARYSEKCSYRISEETNKFVLVITGEAKKESSSIEKASLIAAEKAVSTDEAVQKDPLKEVAKGLSKQADIDQVIPYLNLSNADIPALLNTIVTEAGFNLVTSKSVAGTIPSIQLRNVTLRKVLDLILKQNGFTYKIEQNIIRVATPAELKAEEEDALLETRNFVINFGKAAEIKATILPFLTTGKGKVEADVRTNTVIITDIAQKLEVFTELIKKLDSKTAQVSIEAKLVDIKYENEEKLGIKWDISNIVSAGVAEIVEPSSTIPTVIKGSVSPQVPAGTGGLLQFGIASDSFKFYMALDALISNNDANLLANPRITTLDNKTATITISQAYTYVAAYNPTTGVYTYASIDAGVTLQVTPQVNNNDYITLSVKPTVSSITAAGPPPTVDSRTADTTVLIRDGETLVIGGLIREDEVITINKVPLLSDIPLIGSFLFQGKDVKKIKRDLVVFITPRIVK